MSTVDRTRLTRTPTGVRAPTTIVPTGAADRLAQQWTVNFDYDPAGDLDGCLVRRCDGNHHSLGLCLRHYQQHQYWADPERARAKRRARYARKQEQAA